MSKKHIAIALGFCECISASMALAQIQPESTLSQPLSQPSAVSGGRLMVDVGGALPVGDTADDNRLGFEAGISGGYEFVLGSIGLTPQLVFDYVKFSEKAFVRPTIVGRGLGPDETAQSSTRAFNIMAGSRIAFFTGRTRPYLNFALGYGDHELSISSQGQGTRDYTREGKFVISVGAGVDFAITQMVSVEVFTNYRRIGGTVWLNFGVGPTLKF